MKKLVLQKGYNQYGAQMGRKDILPDKKDAAVKLRMEKLRWVDGDYDQFGAYWGKSDKGGDIYCAHGQWGIPFKDVFIFIRAREREEAKMLIKDLLPNSKFFR
jgi:hypothetical protein